MQRRFFTILLLILLFSEYSYSQKNISTQFFKKSDRFFQKYIFEGQVDYHSILGDPSHLDELVHIISIINVRNELPKFRKAFYINAYNILLIKNVINNFPIPFPLEEIGFFGNTRHLIAGDTLSLNEIECIKLIDEFKDVRLLFVLSSASRGSIPLSSYAFKPGKLNRQFKRRIRETVNNYDFIRVMKRSSLILLAEALKKSVTHFKQDDIVAIINKYRKKPLPVGFTIEFYPANRKLNIKN